VEKGIIARALRYNWPPGSWETLSIARLVRIYQVEAEMHDAQESASPPTPERPDDDEG